jgi:single-strand DNA-binding protein
MMNRVVLVGRLTKDPDLRYTPNGVPVATFTLAVNRNFKKENGEQEADFINVVVWRKPAENAANYLKKGSLAGVDGRIQVRTYEQDGKRQYFTEIIADSVQFLDTKSRNESENTQSNTNTRQHQNNSNSSQNNGYTRVDEDPFAGQGQIDISSDDLPF